MVLSQPLPCLHEKQSHRPRYMKVRRPYMTAAVGHFVSSLLTGGLSDGSLIFFFFCRPTQLGCAWDLVPHTLTVSQRNDDDWYRVLMLISWAVRANSPVLVVAWWWGEFRLHIDVCMWVCMVQEMGPRARVQSLPSPNGRKERTVRRINGKPAQTELVRDKFINTKRAAIWMWNEIEIYTHEERMHGSGWRKSAGTWVKWMGTVV